MNEPRDNPTPSRTVVSILGAFLLLGGALLGAGGKDYPDLHMMLDTSVFLLSGLLGLLLWQIGLRSSNPFPKWIAISFAVTSLSEFVHAFVSVEWSGPCALFPSCTSNRFYDQPPGRPLPISFPLEWAGRSG